MFCLNALYWQITTLFSVPQELLLLRHKVFREYARIAVGPDFIHTLPSIVILTAAIVVLWKHPPASKRLSHLLGATSVYRGLQVSVSWLTINVLLWLWLILQRILYCSVWHYWSYESEHREILHRAWWQRLWSSYYPAHVQPSVVSTEFISWIIAMSMTLTALGFAVYMDRVGTFIKNVLTKVGNALVMIACYVKLPWEEFETEEAMIMEENMAMEGSEIGSISDDTPSEMSVDMNCPASADVRPISYRTNWIPQANFATFKEAHRKISMKSFHTVAGVNDIQDSDKIAAKQARHRRGCHTIIPSNSSEQSSEH
ncbi:PREDICTED: uncharacterized protein LOC106747962 [Dinoponera quadriceps]|uniref:Uncharacterized protein LOC106747962 n=1 Tax=Dinoponera quadriceps TaxID=609295 RepID=A0A6P3XSV8_DINQU|nr:PREDICTED: uncharacterized protein LOC106747962 [Dinoponera quadriceps]